MSESDEYSGRLRTYRHRVYPSGDKGAPQAWLQIRKRWWQVATSFSLWQDHSHADNALRKAESKAIELAYDLQEALNLVKEVSKQHEQVVASVLDHCPHSGKHPPFKDKPRPIEGEVLDRHKEYKEVFKAIQDGSMFDGKANTRQRPRGSSTEFYVKGQPPPAQHYQGGPADVIHAWDPPPRGNNKGNSGNRNNKNQNNQNKDS